MVFDGPDMQEGGQMRFADLKNTAARCWLTQEEIWWNAQLIKEEAEEQRRGSASVATPATRAPDTPPRRTKRGDDVGAPEGSLATTASTNASEGNSQTYQRGGAGTAGA